MTATVNRTAGSNSEGGPPGFVLGDLLGRGASGAVYRATQHSTGRPVALKLITGGIGDTGADQLFATERAALAGLAGHPNVVSIVDAGEWNGSSWIAMEYFARGPVALPGDRLPVEDVLAILAAIASALRAAHERGVLHCDVKPANILRSEFGQAALGDFGIAKLIARRGAVSVAGNYTLDHVAPEVFDRHPPTSASDVYSLGTTAWEMLEGRPPFRTPTDSGVVQTIERIHTTPLPPPTRDDVPAALTELLHRMTAKRPVDRPDVATVADTADAIRTGRPVPSHSASTGPGAFSPFATSAPPPFHGPFPTSGSFPSAQTGWGPDQRASPAGGGHTVAGGVGMTSAAAGHRHPGLAPDALGPVPGPVTGARRRVVLTTVTAVAVVSAVAGLGGFLWATSGRPEGPGPGSVTTTTAAAASTAPAAPTAPLAAPGAAPGSASVARAQIVGVDLFEGNGSMMSDGYYHVSGTQVSFSVKATDANGNRPTSGCSAQLFASDTPVGYTRCNTGRVSFTADPGTYVLTARVTYDDRVTDSPPRYLSVDG